MALRLPVGRVTALLGPSVARRRVMNALDEGSGRCAEGHGAGVCRLGAQAATPVADRLAALEEAGPAAIVLVDRFTDGLGAAERRAVLAGLRTVAARGAAVLVDDLDPVAALSVADGALRVDRDGGLAVEQLAYLAS